MDPAKMKVVDLRSELGALGLDTKGNKPALVERLKKALEAKSGKAIADTTILDTSTEDADEPATPRRAGPAARTRRRSSSTKVASTPKVTRVETPEPIAEEPQSVESSPEPEAAQKESSPEPEAAPEQPQPVPAPTEEPEPEREPEVQLEAQSESEMYNIDDDKSQSPPPEVKKDSEEPMDAEEAPSADEKKSEDAEKMDEDGEKKEDSQKKGDGENETEAEARQRELTEEEEWEQLNERLQVREKERLEREKKQAEEDAKRLEELSNDPVKLQRLKRKHEKKARWSNFYKAVEITNEVLTPPAKDENRNKGKKQEATDSKVLEPELDDNKMTLSWYDSDLNQYLEVPELTSVVPLSDGAFAHAWAGARATHGVGPDSGRVCYEVRVGAVVTTTETTEKEAITNGLRVGWSTDDSTLHLGEGEFSFGYESTGRVVNNGEFKEYGKAFNEKDVIGVYLDLDSSPCKVSYTHNGVELGVAHEFERSALGERALYPHVLTKNTCYRVNFGDDQYNMLTKTKIVRKRVEIPIEQVLEEKRLREEEIQREKDEAARKERERRERERREREERQRKKREEREKQEKERKEKEAQEKKEREEESGEKETPAAADGAGDVEMSEPQSQPEAENQDEPKENGEKSEEAVEVKQEPEVAAPEAEKEVMEEDKEDSAENNTDNAENKEDAENNKEAETVKEEPAPEGAIPEVTEEQVLKGHVLDKRIKFVIRFTVEQEIDGPEACLVPGYVLIAHAQLTEGPRRPATLAECEVILMVGMPGSGKTYWAKQHIAAHPEKRYNVLSTGALFERMQVDCKPFRDTCEGRWDTMLSKGAKCVLKLLEFAHGRRRNYILDQTNVYPSAQRRKLREFDGYRRVAVVIVPTAETFAERGTQREQAAGKEVPDGAVMDMKANFTLPEKCSWIDEVIYPELDEEEAKKIVEAFHKEAKAAGVVRERERRDRSDSRDAPPNKRQRSADNRHRDERRKEFGRDREDRWGGGGGGGNSRWGPASRGGGGGAGGGGRWGPRDRPGPPQGRFDRPWGGRDGPGGGGGGYGRDRERDGGFRGGRGGGARDRAPPRPDTRFPPRDQRPPGPPGALQDKRIAHQESGGGGGWQRGGAGGGRGRGGPPARGAGNNMQRHASGKDAQGQGQQSQQQGWNQWANSGWGGWGNWNQNQAGWGNWGNWGNWNAQQGAGAGGAGAGGAAGAGATAGGKGQQGQQATQQQWQQWYQWQQWQQQQGWPGYGQTGGAAGAAGTQQDQQAWAQYYQNYNANAAAGNAAVAKK